MGAIEALIQLNALFPNLIVANHSYFYDEEDNGPNSDAVTFSDISWAYSLWQDLTAIPGLVNVLAAGNGLGFNGGDGELQAAAVLLPYTVPLPALQTAAATQSSPLYTHIWPQSYALPNMVIVANTSSTDQSGWYDSGSATTPPSNYNGSYVDIGAPGTNVSTTTYVGYGTDSTKNFITGGTLGGTSFSAPLVAGTIALEAIAAPSLMYNGAALITALESGADTGAALNPANNLSGLVTTNGRLNVYGAIVKAQQAASPSSGFSKWTPYFGKLTTW